jgi:hypothetical protein
MNGSNTLPEADARPLALCPECEAKAAAVAGLDPATRLEHLAAFYDRIGLAAEAAEARRILASRPRGISNPAGSVP